MTRPRLADLQPFLPPPADLTRLSDGELAKCLWAMGWRFSDGCADHVNRLLLEAAQRMERRDG